VLAHELGHERAGDLWRALGLSALTTLVALWFASVALNDLPSALVHSGVGSFSALPALALSVGVASVPLGVLARAYSRRRERVADTFGVRIGGDGEGFARALERLCDTNLAELEPPAAYVALRMTHPAPAERIAAARAFDEGRTGKEAAAQRRTTRA
jgi:STE24 endopeptidase